MNPSPEQIVMIGSLIALLLEPIKLVPWIVSRKLFPVIAVCLGIFLAATFFSEPGTASGTIILIGTNYGLAGIGTRSAVSVIGNSIPTIPAMPEGE